MKRTKPRRRPQGPAPLWKTKPLAVRLADGWRMLAGVPNA